MKVIPPFTKINATVAYNLGKDYAIILWKAKEVLPPSQIT
jgi:hypothetical protein